MDDNELKSIVYSYVKEICHFSQMQVFATSYYQKNYFQLQIDEKIDGMISLIIQVNESGQALILNREVNNAGRVIN